MFLGRLRKKSICGVVLRPSSLQRSCKYASFLRTCARSYGAFYFAVGGIGVWPQFPHFAVGGIGVWPQFPHSAGDKSTI